ncbi:MAG: hypothetical protein KZQ73_16050, partial [Candidatus Thiodiazotropha sp. (ex Semelilucina semeliformis)]|nr:hypothetical protein [Candidatus Thiodiazotropha sp. (ex Semelilucina semeliformis)]
DAQNALLTPRYDDEVHTKAREGYTLTDFPWENVYPNSGSSSLSLTSTGYQSYVSLDLYEKVASSHVNVFPNDTGREHSIFNLFMPGHMLAEKNNDLYYSNKAWSFFTDFAHADCVAHEARIDYITDDWNSEFKDLLVEDLYDTKIADLRSNTTMLPINGSLEDAVLDVDGDLLLLQRSAREGASYLLRRLGSTLGNEVAKKLFTKGVDGLLDIQTQKALGEASKPITLSGSAIEDGVIASEIDYKGSYGVYYREIFFHIPFLIAYHLNSQGKYKEANDWYQKIFNPTSSEVIPDDAGLSDEENAARKKDRNWQYLEFRNLGIPQLRDILTDKVAIEAYKKDPFNPHAIARLRISGYQKTIVMKYIDNLLDWADSLFTQFQMETVNEATMLYITAADILGDRPAELGDCGEEKISPRTYEKIAPALKEGSDFLIELENWYISKWPSRYVGPTKVSFGYTVDKSILSSVTRDASAHVNLASLGLRSNIKMAANAPTEENLSHAFSMDTRGGGNTAMALMMAPPSGGSATGGAEFSRNNNVLLSMTDRATGITTETEVDRINIAESLSLSGMHTNLVDTTKPSVFDVGMDNLNVVEAVASDDLFLGSHWKGDS